MRFDSHVFDLLTVSSAVVNALTSRAGEGEDREPLRGDRMRARLGEVLVRDTGTPVVTEADAGVMIRLARDLREIFEAAADEDHDAAAAASNRLLAWAKPAPRLDRHDDGWNLHFHGPTDHLGDGWAAGCAAAVSMALGSRGAGRLGVCAASGCDRVYVDHSKNSTKIFCGVLCQNRVKNARHRQVAAARRQSPTGGDLQPSASPRS